jgi:hypothetical protein
VVEREPETKLTSGFSRDAAVATEWAPQVLIDSIAEYWPDRIVLALRDGEDVLAAVSRAWHTCATR